MVKLSCKRYVWRGRGIGRHVASRSRGVGVAWRGVAWRTHARHHRAVRPPTNARHHSRRQPSAIAHPPSCHSPSSPTATVTAVCRSTRHATATATARSVERILHRSLAYRRHVTAPPAEDTGFCGWFRLSQRRQGTGEECACARVIARRHPSARAGDLQSPIPRKLGSSGDCALELSIGCDGRGRNSR